jgi:vitamin B12/bleomycin/antimicrobial peptide transport system ATP-binding/permease protein
VLTGKAKRVRNFDRRLWSRFWQIAKLYWFGEDKWKARGMLGILVLLLVGRTQFAVLFNDQTGEFTSALAARDNDRFWHAMRIFGAALVAAVPLYAFYYYARDRLGIHWRRSLTEHFLGRYLKDRAFYELTSNAGVDNPDQRIAEDIKSFTQKSLSYLFEIVSATLQLVAFSGILWSISKPLVFFLVLYAAVGSAITFGVFGKPMIALNFMQLRREADFRFSLIRIRENAESIAFYQGETQEAGYVNKRFDELYGNYMKLIKRTLGLSFFQYAYGFFALAVPSIIVAPRIMSGELEVGRALQASGAFAAMLAALTVFIDNFDGLSAFAAGIERLHVFSKTLATKHDAPPRIQHQEDPELQLQAVTLKVPDHDRLLVREVSLQLAAGQGLAITGPSGSGKSSLLRAVAGLWTSGEGTILRPGLDEMMFLPQRPYMIPGSLRGQLLYPRGDAKLTDEALAEVLNRVNLTHLVERCGGFDEDLDFGKLLSIGEQQRLAIARALLAKPRYLVLDEATSALDADNEKALYEALLATNSTLISVTHHQPLIQYHSHVLQLASDGSWQLSDTGGPAHTA